MKFTTRIFLVTGLGLAACAITGCATIEEAGKKLLGVSTRALEEGRKDALKQTFAYNLDACYDKLKKGLKGRGCYIYALDPKTKMIAVYISETDTTPVGIFFKKVDDKNTQVEVSSPSPWAKEFMLRRISSVLLGTADPDLLKQKEIDEKASQQSTNKVQQPGQTAK